MTGMPRTRKKSLELKKKIRSLNHILHAKCNKKKYYTDELIFCFYVRIYLLCVCTSL